MLRQITINDLPVGRNVDETLRLVQALQFADEHGAVCPIGWTPGQRTINPAKADEYFSTLTDDAAAGAAKKRARH